VFVCHTIAALHHLRPHAHTLRSGAGGDVNHTQKGIGAVGDGVGAALNFDAFDLIDGHTERAPVDTAKQVRRVHRAAIDIDLHALGDLPRKPVVADHRAPTGCGGDLKAWHKAKNIGQLARTDQADELAVEHGDRSSGIFQFLGQPRCRINLRYFAQEIFFRQLVGRVLRQGRGRRGKAQRHASGPLRETAEMRAGRRHVGSDIQANLKTSGPRRLSGSGDRGNRKPLKRLVRQRSNKATSIFFGVNGIHACRLCSMASQMRCTSSFSNAP
jgi:hypothetical protein